MSISKKLLIVIGVATLLCVVAGAWAQSDTTQLLLQKAHTLEQRGRIDLAAKVWEQVLLAEPKNPEALDGLARFSKQSGTRALGRENAAQPQTETTTSHLDTAEVRMALDPQQKAKLDQASKLAAAHNPTGAMQLYKEVLGAHPPEGDWSLAYYETLAGTPNGSAESITRLRELAKRHPEDTRYALALGRLLTYNPRTRAEGVKELETIPATDASSAQVHDAWRQALIWEHGNPAYEASVREFLNRYPDPNLEKEFGPVRAVRSAEEIGNDRDEQAAYQALRDNDTERAGQLYEKLRANPAQLRVPS